MQAYFQTYVTLAAWTGPEWFPCWNFLYAIFTRELALLLHKTFCLELDVQKANTLKLQNTLLLLLAHLGSFAVSGEISMTHWNLYLLPIFGQKF